MSPFAIAESDRAAYHAAATIASNFLFALEESAAALLGAAGDRAGPRCSPGLSCQLGPQLGRERRSGADRSDRPRRRADDRAPSRGDSRARAGAVGPLRGPRRANARDRLTARSRSHEERDADRRDPGRPRRRRARANRSASSRRWARYTMVTSPWSAPPLRAATSVVVSGLRQSCPVRPRRRPRRATRAISRPTPSSPARPAPSCSSLPRSRRSTREGFATSVEVHGLSDVLCGDPGGRGAAHFKGVTTVVAKLLNIIEPDVAFFGQKDAQQAMCPARMVDDLAFDVELRVEPTVRDPDGLAMSCRNAYLDRVRAAGARDPGRASARRGARRARQPRRRDRRPRRPLARGRHRARIPGSPPCGRPEPGRGAQRPAGPDRHRGPYRPSAADRQRPSRTGNRTHADR